VSLPYQQVALATRSAVSTCISKSFFIHYTNLIQST